MKSTIHINSFVRRQTLESGHSHWTISDDQLLDRISNNLHKAKTGYRKGVILVPVEPEGFFSSTILLKSGDKLVGEYTARHKEEEPRKSVYSFGQKTPAVSVYVVLYSHDVLVENNENETDCDYEIVSVNANPTEEEAPIQPDTLIANHFQLSGGTSTNMTDSEFVAALRNSVLYWKDKTMVCPKHLI
jgi:Protein of unknown function (DUF3228)